MNHMELYERSYKIYPAVKTIWTEKGKFRVILVGFFREDQEKTDIQKIVFQIQQAYPEFELVKIKKYYDYNNRLYCCYKKHKALFYLKEV